MRLFTSTRARTRALVAVAVLVALVAAATMAFTRVLPSTTDPLVLREWVLDFGALAPVVFVTLQATQVVVAPVPGQVLGFVGGYLFGTAWGTAFSLLGATVGSAVVFVVSRRFGRSFVEDVVAADVLSTFDDVVDENGLLALFLVFLVPGLPDDAICLVAGLTRIPIWQLVLVGVLGRLPGYTLVAYAGASAAQARLLDAALVLAGLAVVSLVVYWRREAVTARLRG